MWMPVKTVLCPSLGTGVKSSLAIRWGTQKFVAAICNVVSLLHSRPGESASRLGYQCCHLTFKADISLFIACWWYLDAGFGKSPSAHFYWYSCSPKQCSFLKLFYCHQLAIRPRSTEQSAPSCFRWGKGSSRFGYYRATRCCIPPSFDSCFVSRGCPYLKTGREDWRVTNWKGFEKKRSCNLKYRPEIYRGDWGQVMKRFGQNSRLIYRGDWGASDEKLRSE